MTRTPIAGGDINQAFRVEDEGRRWFEKTHRAPPPGMYASEAAGLETLSAASDEHVLVPQVLEVTETHLALEWMGDREGAAVAIRGRTLAAGEALGVGLAHIHRRTDPRGFGFETDNWIGTLPQRNTWIPAEQGAAAFFIERRLMPQLEIAAGSQALPGGCAKRLEALCLRLPDLVPNEPPSLIHGDLWGGNWMADPRGRAWIFDPAAAYGPREQDLAFTKLFGGFPDVFYRAYEAEWPLEPGFAGRVDLWNLYPLLVHANLFGGGYGGRVDRIARRFV